MISTFYIQKNIISLYLNNFDCEKNRVNKLEELHDDSWIIKQIQTYSVCWYTINKAYNRGKNVGMQRS